MFALLETDPLMPLSQAKQMLKTALTPRIVMYEERLKKPWLKRGLEYFTTSYGETGYKRTKDFLADMEKEDIASTEDLIRLIGKAKYQDGHKMPSLLHSAVLEFCRFDNWHVLLVEEDTIQTLCNERDRFAAIVIANSRTVAIEAIYEKIMASKDFGKSYLEELDRRLYGARKEPERPASFRW